MIQKETLVHLNQLQLYFAELDPIQTYYSRTSLTSEKL